MEQSEKNEKKKKKKKKKRGGIWTFIKVQIVLLVLVLTGIGVYYGSGIGGKVDTMYRSAKEKVQGSTVATFQQTQSGIVYDEEGEVLSVLKGEKDVYYLNYENIPAYVKAAFISIEDKKFYSHIGIDFKAIVRSMWSLVRNKEITQGGSTITQQLSRNVFLSFEVSWARKIEEMFIAMELEKRYSKEQILEFYINNVYFANGYYGIQAASKGYFNQDVKDLSLAQITFLCAIPNNPTLYEPLEKKENTLKRRNRILGEMLEDGKITDSTYQEALTEEITFNRSKIEKKNYVETYVYNCATRALMAEEGFVFRNDFETDEEKEEYQNSYDQYYTEYQKKLYTNGYRIYTSISMDMQDQLQNTVDENLAEYDSVSAEGVYELQGAAVCIDNKTGYVKAIVGGRSQESNGYTLNRGFQSYRQPGSAIKPLVVYTPSLEREYTPDSTVYDVPIEDGPKSSSYLGSISLRTAVEKSKNSVAWTLFEELTPEVGLSYLKEMGFARIVASDNVLPASLGGLTNGASAVEMAAAYATIENDGKYREPTCIVKITDAQGEKILETEYEYNEGKEIYKENAARMMTDVMTGVLTRGTAQGLGLTDMPAAGKTGTTNDNKDGWFVGYSRYYTTSVWVGYDMPKELPGLTGSSYPAKIWNQYMEQLHQGLLSMDFLPYVDYTGGQDQSTPDNYAPPQEETPPEEVPPEEEPVTEETPPVDPNQPTTPGDTPPDGTQTPPADGTGGTEPPDTGGTEPPVTPEPPDTGDTEPPVTPEPPDTGDTEPPVTPEPPDQGDTEPPATPETPETPPDSNGGQDTPPAT